MIVSCHVEPRQKKTEIKYLTQFFQEVDQIKIPIILLFMFGERASGNLLDYLKDNKFKFRNPIGLHVHNHETKSGIEKYKKVFGKYPKNISFGHWQVSSHDIELLQKYKIKNDYSYAGHQNNMAYFTKPPFIKDKIKFYPVSCNPKYPINPVTAWYDLLLAITLILLNRIKRNDGLHLSFHSYDPYDGVTNKIRWQMFIFTLALFHA